MKKFGYVILVMMSLMLAVSCSKKKSGNNVVQARSARDQLTALGGNGVYNNNGTVGTAQGIIFTSSMYQTSFDQALRGLVSSTMNPAELGTVNYQNGVRFTGYIDLTANGQVNPATSRLRIEIYDNMQSPYPISFAQAQSGMFNAQGGSVTFEDQYGSIIIEGKFDVSGYFIGILKFQNKTSFDGSQPKYGTVGDLQIATCGFFRC